MLPVVDEGSCTLNHGGELKVQQELAEPSPCPRGGHHLSGKLHFHYFQATELCLSRRSSSGPQMREFWVISTSTDTEAHCLYVGILFTNTTSKGPDVLTGGATHYANSIDIDTVD